MYPRAVMLSIFQSTLSMRRATDFDFTDSGMMQFQSTLSMRRATNLSQFGDSPDDISIHALHEESDWTYE